MSHCSYTLNFIYTEDFVPLLLFYVIKVLTPHILPRFNKTQLLVQVSHHRQDFVEETKQSSVFTQASEVTKMEDLDQHNHTDHKAQNRNILHTAIPKSISGNTKKGIIKSDFLNYYYMQPNKYFRHMYFKYSLMSPL